jgi:hypothetical protein
MVQQKDRHMIHRHLAKGSKSIQFSCRLETTVLVKCFKAAE